MVERSLQQSPIAGAAHICALTKYRCIYGLRYCSLDAIASPVRGEAPQLQLRAPSAADTRPLLLHCITNRLISAHREGNGAPWLNKQQQSRALPTSSRKELLQTPGQSPPTNPPFPHRSQPHNAQQPQRGPSVLCPLLSPPPLQGQRRLQDSLRSFISCRWCRLGGGGEGNRAPGPLPSAAPSPAAVPHGGVPGCGQWGGSETPPPPAPSFLHWARASARWGGCGASRGEAIYTVPKMAAVMRDGLQSGAKGNKATKRGLLQGVRVGGGRSARQSTKGSRGGSQGREAGRGKPGRGGGDPSVEVSPWGSGSPTACRRCRPRAS